MKKLRHALNNLLMMQWMRKGDRLANSIMTCSMAFLISGFSAFGQTTYDSLSKKEIRQARPFYFDFGIGRNSSKFTDFATSPLTYKGNVVFASFSMAKRDDLICSELNASFSSGNYFTNLTDGENSFSRASIYSMDYSYLKQLKKRSNAKWNLKAGGMLASSWIIRVNEDLKNNGLGIESFNTLFGSVKVTRDVSRMRQKDKKILFLKYSLKPQLRKLSYRLNIGLINSYLRNSYSYIGQSSVINNYTPFDNYQYDLLSGFRMSSALEYSIFIANGNAYKMAYLWDAYRTSDDLDQFQMAHHTIRFSFLFKAK